MTVVTPDPCGDTLGRGDDGLGRRLLVKFVQQLLAVPPRPHVVAFYNAGVNLLIPSSPVADAFKALETCLDHFQVRDSILAGRVSDMREILSMMASSEKVIVV